jgi:glyceraldehyde-3-phosphate dehydrogenase (NADP+)
MFAFTPANNDKISWDDKELLSHFPSSKDKVPKWPSVTGNQYLVDGEILEFTKATEPISTAIYAGDERVTISSFARCDKDVAMRALDAATRAWDRGRGKWPQASIQERVKAMFGFMQDFKAAKQELADLLMWDICKSAKDAADEVDRTIGNIIRHCHMKSF